MIQNPFEKLYQRVFYWSLIQFSDYTLDLLPVTLGLSKSNRLLTTYKLFAIN